MSKLQLILLGRFECLLSSGTRISLPMRKAEVLLAYLALTPGLRHPRERLINLLWSDRGEEQSANRWVTRPNWRYWSIAARSACNRD
jgi:DNA-binding SARP family transcriptional activator